MRKKILLTIFILSLASMLLGYFLWFNKKPDREFAENYDRMIFEDFVCWIGAPAQIPFYANAEKSEENLEFKATLAFDNNGFEIKSIPAKFVYGFTLHYINEEGKPGEAATDTVNGAIATRMKLVPGERKVFFISVPIPKAALEGSRKFYLKVVLDDFRKEVLPQELLAKVEFVPYLQEQ